MLERIIEDGELIDALRCESVINDEHPRCESCKYGVVVYHGSREDVYGCDSRRIDNDAADAIERQQSDLAKKDSQLTEWKNAWRIANSLYKSAQSELDELRGTEQTEPTEPNEPKGDN